MAVEGFGELLWTPKCDGSSRMEKFMGVINSKYGLSISNYYEFHKWSVENTVDFWKEFFSFAEIVVCQPYQEILSKYTLMSEIPKWFVGCTLNFAENLLRFSDDSVAVISIGEGIKPSKTTFKELNQNVRFNAQMLRNFGVTKGDVVASLLPNVTMAVEMMLAVASVGAIWTCASAETQAMGIILRMKQTEPKLLISYDSVIYNGKKFEQITKLTTVSAEMTSLKCVLIVPGSEEVFDVSGVKNAISWNDFREKYAGDVSKFTYEHVTFDHPLFIMYSSGTTGIPKGLVHSVGGTMIQQLKDHILHGNVCRDDCFLYYTITAWMMWNWLVTALFTGCSIVLYNGSPFYPTKEVIWEHIAEYKISILGAGAAYYQALENNAFKVPANLDISNLRMLLSTGSVLPSHTYHYMVNNFKKDLQIGSIAAATDVISCFGGVNPLIPVYSGQVQCRNLAMSIESWDLDGKHQYDNSGELVVTKPFPSMPVFLWNDEGSKKYHSTYFSKFPSVWAQGDYCQIDDKTHGIVMLGRSDATLNPNGVRFGSSEIYSVVENMEGIVDCLCVSLVKGEQEKVVLFLQLRPGTQLNDEFVTNIKKEIVANLSSRHVPSLYYQISDVPYTLTGKKVELAVKKIISGMPFVIQKESLRNPESLDQYQKMYDDNRF